MTVKTDTPSAGEPQGEQQDPQGSGEPHTNPQPQGEGTEPQGTEGEDLAKARAAARKWEQRANKDREALDALREQVKVLIAPEQLVTAEQQVATLTAERDAAVMDATRYRIALEEGLPAELAARLQGDTESDLRSDAEALRQLTGRSPSGTRRDGAGGTGGDSGPKKTDNELLRAALGY